MKLIICPLCESITQLKREGERIACPCGKSWGQYTVEHNATFGGMSIPAIINNYFMAEAMTKWLKDRNVKHRRRDILYIVGEQSKSFTPEPTP